MCRSWLSGIYWHDVIPAVNEIPVLLASMLSLVSTLALLLLLKLVSQLMLSPCSF
jgi:hypothetical protein